MERIQAKIVRAPSCTQFRHGQSLERCGGSAEDDMWLQEMMLGCDTELFETVRQVRVFGLGPGVADPVVCCNLVTRMDPELVRRPRYNPHHATR